MDIALFAVQYSHMVQKRVANLFVHVGSDAAPDGVTVVEAGSLCSAEARGVRDDLVGQVGRGLHSGILQYWVSTISEGVVVCSLVHDVAKVVAFKPHRPLANAVVCVGDDNIHGRVGGVRGNVCLLNRLIWPFPGTGTISLIGRGNRNEDLLVNRELADILCLHRSSTEGHGEAEESKGKLHCWRIEVAGVGTVLGRDGEARMLTLLREGSIVMNLNQLMYLCRSHKPRHSSP